MFKKTLLLTSLSFIILFAFATNGDDIKSTETNTIINLGYNLRPFKLPEILVLPTNPKVVTVVKKKNKTVIYNPIFDVPKIKLTNKESRKFEDKK